MSQIPIGPPQVLIAGDIVTFSVVNSCYGSADWDMAFVMVATGLAPVSVDADAQADGSYLVTLTGPQTATVNPEQYSCAYVFTQGDPVNTARKTIPVSLPLWVVPDPTQTNAPSPNQVQLAALQSAMLKLSAGTNLSVNINGQTYTKRDVAGINKQIVYIQSRILRDQEQLKALLGQPYGRIVTEFVYQGGYPAFPTSTGGCQ